MYVTGLNGTEMMLAELVAELEVQESVDRQAGRHAEAAARRAAEARLDDMEDAAGWRLASGVASGASQIGAAAAQSASTSARASSSRVSSPGASTSDVAAPGASSSGLATAGCAAPSTASQRLATTSKLVTADGQLHSSLFGHLGSAADRAAERNAIGEDELRSRVADIRERRERTRSFADKALGHIAEIARARMEAQMRSVRG